jgi:hypothetical protein
MYVRRQRRRQDITEVTLLVGTIAFVLIGWFDSSSAQSAEKLDRQESIASAEGDKIPNDFRLAAEYYPPPFPRYLPVPWKPWYPWTVTITANGRAVQETDLSLGDEKRIAKKSFRLTRQDLTQLVRVVQKSGFSLLGANYSDEVTDNDTLILRITMNRNYHEVMVYAPARLKQKEEVAAFLSLWNEVLKHVPPPNLGQGAE